MGCIRRLSSMPCGSSRRTAARVAAQSSEYASPGQGRASAGPVPLITASRSFHHFVRSSLLAQACTTIQEAMELAPPGSTVRVHSGTYTGVGNRLIYGVGKDVAIVGDADSPTIDCEQVGALRTTHHLRRATANVQPTFTIQSGRTFRAA
jgi:hypothetical protein